MPLFKLDIIAVFANRKHGPESEDLIITYAGKRLLAYGGTFRGEGAAASLPDLPSISVKLMRYA